MLFVVFSIIEKDHCAGNNAIAFAADVCVDKFMETGFATNSFFANKDLFALE